MNNDKVLEYLESTIGVDSDVKIEQLQNGGYYVSNWKGNGKISGSELYLPPNFDAGNISVVAHLPGSNGSPADARFVRENFKGEDAPNYIVAISGRYTDNAEILDCVSDICSDNKVNITDLSLTSFSASGGQGFVSLEKFLEKNPNTNATMFVADGFDEHGQNLTPDCSYIQDVDSLAASKSPVYLVVSESNFHEMDKFAKDLIDKGVDVKLITTARGGHTSINHDLIQSFMAEYSIGLVDELQGDNTKNCNYTILTYDSETGKFISTDTPLESLKTVSDTSVTFKLLNMPENPYEEGTLGADLYEVGSHINAIRGTLGNTTYQGTTCEGTSTIPGQLSTAQNSLFSISNDLNNTLATETVLIASIAQTIHDMDVERAKAASQLSDGSNLLSADGLYDKILNSILTLDLASGNTTFQNFMFDPGSHREGNSGKVCMSDINAMLSGSSLIGPLHENFEGERTEATKTKGEVDNLINLITTSNNFQGDIWNYVNDKLNLYSDSLQLRIESANKLESAMVKALTLVKNYMGDYEELDDSKLPELRQKIVDTKAAIESAKHVINATRTVTHTYEDEKGVLQYYYTTEYVYSASARQQAMEFIKTATVALQAMEAEVAKLEGLPVILAQAEQIVNDALSEIYSSYGSSVSDIVTGEESSYIPPANTNYSGTLPKTSETKPEVPEGKISEEEFNAREDLQNEYGSYNDYLNNVKAVNNPMYNKDMVDTGLNIDGTPNPNLNNNPNIEDDKGKPEDETKPKDESEEKPENETKPEDETKPKDEPEKKTEDETKPKDEPSNNTPSQNKPSNNTPSQNKPSNNTPSQDKPSNNTPSQDKPSNDTPSQDKPSNDTPPQDKPSNNTPSQDKPSNDTPSQDKPSNNTPSQDKPSNDTPSQDKPSNDTPSQDKPSNDTPSQDKPSNDTPSQDKPSNDTPSQDKPSNDTPSQDKPSNDTPFQDKPSNDTPSQDKPSNDTPSQDKPSNDTPSQDKPSEENNSQSKPENDDNLNNTPNNNNNNNSGLNNNNNTNNNIGTNENNSNSVGNNNSNNAPTYKPSTPTVDSNNTVVPDTNGDNISNDGVVDAPVEDSVMDNNVNNDINNIPPIVEIPEKDEIIDITPSDVYENINNNNNTSSESSDLAKKIAVGVGVGAAVGAAALGAHTYSKAKKNDIYEDDEK